MGERLKYKAALVSGGATALGSRICLRAPLR